MVTQASSAAAAGLQQLTTGNPHIYWISLMPLEWTILQALHQRGCMGGMCNDQL